MPTYVGREINLSNFRLGSASNRLRELMKQDTGGIRAHDGSLGGKNIRVANRKIVITTLKRSLALDVQIGCFDLNLIAGIFVMGKSGRSLHKGNIKGTSINLSGTLLATCGDDKRIIVWSLTTFKALKVIEGHTGIIYQVEFSTDDEKLLSSSEDGRVVVWDWKTGTAINSCMRHSFSVRSFDFNYDRPEMVVCAQSDGHVSVWNTQHSIRIDNIIPDPEWRHFSMEENLLGWMDLTKNHTGAILTVRLAPNGRFLASGATDNTCKVWNISSYRKDLEVVQKELNETEEYYKQVSGCIDITDPKYNEQLKFKEFTCLKVGEVPLRTGYHADLRYTLRHDAPVTCVRWSCNSEIIITGSMDATCRLWSSRRGELLFQINLPGPVSSINVDLRDYIFISCQNRLLIFSIKALFKESDLPGFWQASEVKQVVDDMRYIHTSNQADKRHESKFRDEEEAPKYVTVSELRKLLAHGMVLPRILQTLSSQFSDVDGKQLESNMRKHNVHSRQVLRLLTNQPFHPRDILKALATKSNTSILYSLISHGSPIIGYLLRLGFNQLDDGRDRTTVRIDPKDLQAQLKAFGDNTKRGRGLGNAELQIDSAWKGWVNEVNDSGEESGEDEPIDDEIYQTLRTRQPKGRVLHFIPSEKMKLLKDLKSSRDLKPIFLRSLAMDTQEPRQFPNFMPNSDLEEKKEQPQPPPYEASSRKGPRFNENLDTYVRKSTVARTSTYQEAGRVSIPMPLAMSNKNAAIKASLSSSTTIFQPNRYMQTRGLNVTFEGDRMSTYSQPIVIREAVEEDDRLQMVVGAAKVFKDIEIDAIDDQAD